MSGTWVRIKPLAVNVSVSVNVCLKAYSKTGPHIHLVQEFYSGAHASAARPPGGRTTCTALHDLFWATGCAVSMSNTRGVAVCDTRDTNRNISSFLHTTLGCSWVCRWRRGPARTLARTSRTNHCRPRQLHPIQASGGGDFQLSPHNPSALPSQNFLALPVVDPFIIPGVAHLSWVSPAQNG